MRLHSIIYYLNNPNLALSKLHDINSRAVSDFGLLRYSSRTQAGKFIPTLFFFTVHIRRTCAFAASTNFSCKHAHEKGAMAPTLRLRCMAMLSKFTYMGKAPVGSLEV